MSVTATSRPTLPDVGDVVAGRYEVLRSLGTGATGHVFLARHTSLDKEVALKVLTPKAAEDPEQAERFLREARAASGLEHPRIVEITDFGSTDDGLPFLAMEYLAGEDLAACLARTRRLAWPRARALMLEVLDGLACAHAHGVVHRDLKPENIFLARDSREDGATSVKLVDFGIAKLLTEPTADRLTNDGHILGTPHYMSPEQAVGKHVDARSDLYACGVLLFEMLTGQLPFSDGSTMAILSRQITQAPPTLASAAQDLELPVLPELEVVIARALHKDPEQRYATAEEFAEAIRAVGREPKAGESRRWSLSAAALLMLVLVGAVWTRSDPASNAPPTGTEIPPATDPSPETPSAAPVEEPEAIDGMQPQPEPDPVLEPPDETPPGTVAVSPTRRRASPRQPSSAKTEPAPPPPLPERASDEIVVQHLQRAARQCSAFVGRGGQDLDVEVNIAADGDVYGAIVLPPYGGDHPLGRCVAKRLNAARVPAAQDGRSYRGAIRVVQSR